MPLVRKFRGLSFHMQAAIVGTVLLSIVGALLIGVIALSSSDAAGRQAQIAAARAERTSMHLRQAMDCIDKVLGARNGPTLRFSHGFESFERIIFSPSLSDPEKARAAAGFIHATHKWHQALAANPLGKCT